MKKVFKLIILIAVIFLIVGIAVVDGSKGPLCGRYIGAFS